MKSLSLSHISRKISPFTDAIIDMLYPKSTVLDYQSIRSLLRERSEQIIKDSEIAQIEIGQSEFLLKIKNKLLKMVSGSLEKELVNILSFLGWWGAKEFTVEDLVNLAVYKLKKEGVLLLGGVVISIIVMILFGSIAGLLLLIGWIYISYKRVLGEIYGNIAFFKEYYDRLKDEDTLFAPTVISTLSEPSIPLMIKKMASGSCGSISEEVKSFAGLTNAKQIFLYWSASHPVTGIRYLEGIVANENVFKDIITKLKMSEAMMKTIGEELKSLFTRIATDLRDKLSVGGTMTSYIPLMIPLFFGLIGWGRSPLLALQIPLVWFLMKGLKQSILNSEARYLISMEKVQKEVEIAKNFGRLWLIPLTIIGIAISAIFCKKDSIMDLIMLVPAGFFFAISIIIIYAGIAVDKYSFKKPTDYLKDTMRFCQLLKNPPKSPDNPVDLKGIDGEYNYAVAVAGQNSDFPDEIKKILSRASIGFRAEDAIKQASMKLPPLARPFLEGVIPILKMDKKKLGDEIITRSKVLSQYIVVLSEVINAAITWETIEAYIAKRSKYVGIMLGVMMGVIVVVSSMLDGILMLLFEGLAMNISGIFKGIAYVFQNLGRVLISMAIYCGLGVGVGIVALCMEDRLKNIVYGFGAYIITILVLDMIFKLALSLVGDVGQAFAEMANANINLGGFF